MKISKRSARIVSFLCALILALSVWGPKEAFAGNVTISQGSRSYYTAAAAGDSITVTLKNAYTSVAVQGKPSWITYTKSGSKFTLKVAAIPKGTETRQSDVVFRDGSKVWTLRVTQNCAHTYAWQVTVSPTCCKTGTQVYRCTKCKKLGLGSNSYQTIPATGKHSWGAWIVDKAPTCTTSGSKHRKCVNGPATQTATIPAAHTYVTGSNNERKCSRCNLPDYAYYMNSSSHFISTSGSDENGNSKGGTAGDQTGKEWQMTTSFGTINVSPSDVKRNIKINVYRYTSNSNVGTTLARLSIEAALNNNIGYDQNQNQTYLTELGKVKWDPKKITTPCEDDCAAGVCANVNAVGNLLGLSGLKNMPYSYTGSIGTALMNAGYSRVMTDKSSLSASDINSLRAGDIVVVRYEKKMDNGEWEGRGHAVVNVTGN